MMTMIPRSRYQRLARDGRAGGLLNGSSPVVTTAPRMNRDFAGTWKDPEGRFVLPVVTRRPDSQMPGLGSAPITPSIDPPS